MSYNIRNVEIYFPFEPYEVQKKFMEKNSNGLLESPTGTGKTLSTLCSALAWLNHNKERLAEEGIIPLPKIVFATRTHSQIRQVVNEVKDSAYEPKLCVLSSRKALCINQPKNLSGGTPSNDEIRNNCLEKVRTRTCKYYHSSFDDRNFQIDNIKPIRTVEKIRDIEELCDDGKRECFCPYYYQRKIALKDCEVIILPYNYLINPGIKKTIQLDLSNSILIFDEAHNLEKVCEGLSSFYFDSNLFVNSVKELSVLLSKKYKLGAMNTYMEGKRPSIMKLMEMLVELEKHLINDFNRRAKPTTHKQQERVLILRGNYLSKQISEFLDMEHGCEDVISDKMKLLYECQRDLREMKADISEGCGRSPGLSSLRHVLNQFFSFTTLTNEKMKKYFRLIVTQKPPGYKKDFNPKQVGRYFEEYGDFEHFKEEVPFITYEYFCLSPSIAMYELIYSKISIKDYNAMENRKKMKKMGMRDEDEEEDDDRVEELIDREEHDGGELPPKCVILTSGTLSPLPFFEKSFEIPFPIRLQNQHTIQRSQLSALVCTTGPSKKQLSSEFGNRSNPVYIKEISDVIINVCRIVPNGVLVFFPSFSFLNSCMEFWKTKMSNPQSKSSSSNKTVWERLSKIKKIYSEPSNAELQQSGGSNVNFKLSAIIANFEREAETKKGSILLSVCRGRLSEGLDFRDNKCRMVMVVGIPYPPKQDLKVQLKEMYYENILANKNDWYSRQASSAVNQAIGRVIRHRSDYGMILLMDARYTKGFHISRWIGPHKKVCNRFGEVTMSTSKFFQKWKKGLEETVEFKKAERKKYGGGQGGARRRGKGSGKIRLGLRRIELAYTTSQSLEDEDDDEEEGEGEFPLENDNEDKDKEMVKDKSIGLKETHNFQNQGLNYPSTVRVPQIMNNLQMGQQQQQQQQQRNNNFIPQQQLQPEVPSLFIGRSNKINNQQQQQSFSSNMFGRNTTTTIRQNPMMMMNGPPPLPPKTKISDTNSRFQSSTSVRSNSILPHNNIISPPPPPPPPPINNNFITNTSSTKKNVILPPPPQLPIIPQQKQKTRKNKKTLQQSQSRQDFLEILRNTISTEEYARFKSLIVEIKKKERKFKEIASDIIDLIGGIHGKKFCEMFMENLPIRKQEDFKEVWKKKDEDRRRTDENRIVKSKKRKRECGEDEDDEEGLLIDENNNDNQPPTKRRKIDNIHQQQQQQQFDPSNLSIPPISDHNHQHQQQSTTKTIITPSRMVRKPPDNKCMICKDEYKNPHANFVCGHIACEGCWRELKDSGQPYQCPYCRKRIGELRRVYI